MNRVHFAQRLARLGALAALTVAVAPAARCQEFARGSMTCLSLDCAASVESYSFDAIPGAQESSGSSSNSPKPATSSDSLREGEWRRLPVNFLHDQKDMWLFPVSVAEGHHWLPTLLVTGATAALIGTDAKTEPYFRQTDAFQDTNRALGGTVSGAIIAVVPSAFYVASLLRKDSYGQGTSLLAGEAVADDAVLMIVAK